MVEQILAQPEPDGESIAEVVRRRHTELMRRNPPTMAEVDEIVRIQQLLNAHIVYVQQRGKTCG